MRYFYDSVPEYQTRGVAEDVHPYILMRCVEMLAALKEKQIEPDYLQVFRLTYDEQENLLSIKHSQENPDYMACVKVNLPEGVQPYVGKLYYIDDISHRTILKAEEY